MKQIITQIAVLLFVMAAGIAMAGCNDSNASDLRLSGDSWLTSIELDGYTGTIDNASKTVTVGVPETYDTNAMEITAIETSEGAEASMKVGDVVDFSYPQSVKVTNGDAFLDYTIMVKHDEARIVSFRLNDSYTGVINEESHTIQVRVPTTADITGLVATIGVSEGATVTPASGQAIDFTRPVEFTVVYQTATVVYTVTVIQSDAPSAVYVGLASSIDELNAEEREAASWMLQNVANAQYASLQAE